MKPTIFTLFFILSCFLTYGQTETAKQTFEGYYQSGWEISAFYEQKGENLFKPMWLEFDCSFQNSDTLTMLMNKEILRKGVYMKFEGKKKTDGNFGHLGASKELVTVFKILAIDSLKTLDIFSIKNTVLIDKVPFNRDSSIRISLIEFDYRIDSCISSLKEKKLKDISDKQHIEIMMCLNTIFMRDFKGGHYDTLIQLSEEKKYSTDIIKVYPNWIPNRGMGFYFPDLKMELYGTPMLYAIYNVQK